MDEEEAWMRQWLEEESDDELVGEVREAELGMVEEERKDRR